MGGVVGAGLMYANYIHALDIYEGGREIRTLKTAGLFSTYAVIIQDSFGHHPADFRDQKTDGGCIGRSTT